MSANYIEGDIHEVIKTFQDNSINLIYTSPPYGITCAEWDKPLKWKEMFEEMWRVLKPDGIIALHASMPFTYELLKYEKPRYHYTWIKNNSTNFFKAKLQPLRNTEEIFIYYKKTGTYNPQMRGDKFSPKRVVKCGGEQKYFGTRNNIKEGYITDVGGHKGKYPNTSLYYDIRKEKSGITRSDEMMDYFIKTYSNQGDTILDMTCHNDFCGKRAIINKRNYIGVDILLQIQEQ